MKSSGNNTTKTLRQLALGIALLAAVIPLAWQSLEKRSEPEAQHGALKVVVSIAPLHSLVAGIMQGVGEPYLLLKAGDTPHHYNLKPRDVEYISSADIIIASSFTNEYYFAPLLESLGDRPKIRLQMADADGITLLPPAGGDEHEGEFDLHMWLDPLNAIAFSKQAANALILEDPENAETYRTNLDKQVKDLELINSNIKNKINQNSTAGYTSYHALLQYFEHRYGIAASKAAVAVPEAGPSVVEAESVYEQAEAGELKCVLAETEFSSKLLDGVAVKHPEIKRLVLDPLGGQFAPSPKLYGQLLEHVTDVVTQCLK
ncbi:MAG: hypothetical protein FJX23_08845 [Alphaproteobacteria bacterium]|nr:hypothetical protein [Alphaproteobacteria bacterium]